MTVTLDRNTTTTPTTTGEPRPGDTVVLNGTRGTFLGLISDDPYQSVPTVVLVTSTGVKAVAGSVDQVTVLERAGSTVEAAEVTWSLTLLRNEFEAHRRTVREHQHSMTQLVSDAHAYADNHDLCSAFDDFMEEHGFPRRTREYEVHATISVRVCVTVEAESSDDAEEAIDAYMLVDAIDTSEVEWNNVEVM